jgi:hypothetical protein
VLAAVDLDGRYVDVASTFGQQERHRGGPIPAGPPAPVTTAVRGSGKRGKAAEVAEAGAVIAAPSLPCFAQSIKVARMSRM